MSKKKSRKAKKNAPKRLEIHESTRKTIWGIILVIFGAVLTLSYVQQAGVLGFYISETLGFILGSTGFIILIGLAFIGALVFFLSKRPQVQFSFSVGTILLLFSLLGVVNLLSPDKRAGGLLGALITYPLLELLSFWAAFIILAGTVLISLAIIFNISIIRLFSKEEKEEQIKDDILVSPSVSLSEGQTESSQPVTIDESSKQNKKSKEVAEKQFLDVDSLARSRKFKAYQLPPLDLLEKGSGRPSGGDIKTYANIIKRTLENFGIPIEIGEINVGPTVTQYTLKPAEGIKLSKLTALREDLALALAVHPIRIEAPIPGRSLVGIEIPNRAVSLVRLRDLLEAGASQKLSSLLNFSLGKDVSGRPVFDDLSRMPHILIAGSTGSGKSVAIHSLIISLLYRNYPNTLKFLIIDPKRVELSVYEDIPHLLAPVVTEASKAINALKWATKEMERRYQFLAKARCRDIVAYNSQLIKKENTQEFMPYLVIVIDELADLMISHARETETSIVRLAQMARSVGIHLVISTQRPSVEIITGLIKANITNRVAFQVASQVDSRTILDMAGADKLLGNGDMLYLSSESSKPRRIQGGFVSDKEIHQVVKYLQKASWETAQQEEAPSFEKSTILTGESSEIETSDELFEEAKDLIIETQKASASFLQRRLRVGYARAARLLDLLEENGVVGPGEGAKPRQVFIKPEGYNDEEQIV